MYDVGELKMRVSADCAEMKGWRLRHRASYNAKVCSTVVLYSIKVRRGYVCVCSAVKGHSCEAFIVEPKEFVKDGAGVLAAKIQSL